jgi:formamidopyrimidine-DNA glycosylase
MPELPEVETIRLGLSRLIVGKTVSGTRNYNSPKSFPNTDADVTQFLIGASITTIRRRAKVLLIELSSGYTLMTHLKMTGQLVCIAFTGMSGDSGSLGAKGQPVLPRSAGKAEPSSPDMPVTRWGGGHPNDSLVGDLPDKTTRQHIEFSDGSRLYFNDLRKFGWMKLIPTIEVENIDFMKKVGPEPLSELFTAKEFVERIRRRNGTAVKAAILDQTVLAGVGNIYADESLWAAKIHPATRVKDISDKKLAALLPAIKTILTLSIEKGGSTDKNYVDAEGKKGSYLKFANVFRLEGKPCPRCGTTIEKIRVAGRGTHICPLCQVLQ